MILPLPQAQIITSTNASTSVSALVNTATATINAAANVRWDRPDDDGLAGVREPRRPAPSAPPTAR